MWAYFAQTGLTYYGVKKQNASTRRLANLNALQYVEDGKQLLVSIADQTDSLIKETKQVGGRAAATIAGGNLTLEGSPLMAMESIYQQGVKDVNALHKAGQFKLAKLKRDTQIGYEEAESAQTQNVVNGIMGLF